MTKDQLRKLLTEHIRQPGGRRNPGHSVVAIYLGYDDFMSLIHERGAFPSISLREGGGNITFDGVPVYRVNDAHHVRIVSEYKERE